MDQNAGFIIQINLLTSFFLIFGILLRVLRLEVNIILLEVVVEDLDLEENLDPCKLLDILAKLYAAALVELVNYNTQRRYLR